jgi:hypothetical protein
MSNFIKKISKKPVSYNKFNNQTYQQSLTNEQIKEYLKDYKIVNDIKKVNISTHLRYFTVDPNTNKKLFRLGGKLYKFGDNGKYITLSNGELSWSVQIENTIFYQKMSEEEIMEELKEDLRETILSELNDDNSNYKNLEKKNKYLEIENNKINTLLEEKNKEYNKLLKKYDQLNLQIKEIQKEILNSKKNKI